MDDPVSHAGRIVLPEKAQKEPAEGTIEAVGNWDEEYPSIELAIGDRVIVNKYGGVTVRHEGADYKVLDVYRDVLAKLAPGGA